MLGQIIMNNECAFDDTMSASVGSTVAMAMHIPLGLLNAIDLVGNSLDIFCLAGRDLLYTFCIPADIVAIGQVLMGGTILLRTRCWMDGEVSGSVSQSSRSHIRNVLVLQLRERMIYEKQWITYLQARIGWVFYMYLSSRCGVMK